MFTDNCKQLIREAEGLRLKVYKCPSGKLTIGYGHTKDALAGMTINETVAEIYLEQDLKDVAIAIKKYVKVKLNKNQIDALGSFIFNVGAGNFAKSTLLKKINAGDFEGAAKEFLRWNKAWVNGQFKELPGLTKRRIKEFNLFKGVENESGKEE